MSQNGHSVEGRFVWDLYDGSGFAEVVVRRSAHRIFSVRRCFVSHESISEEVEAAREEHFVSADVEGDFFEVTADVSCYCCVWDSDL